MDRLTSPHLYFTALWITQKNKQFRRVNLMQHPGISALLRQCSQALHVPAASGMTLLGHGNKVLKSRRDEYLQPPCAVLVQCKSFCDNNSPQLCRGRCYSASATHLCDSDCGGTLCLNGGTCTTSQDGATRYRKQSPCNSCNLLSLALCSAMQLFKSTGIPWHSLCVSDTAPRRAQCIWQHTLPVHGLPCPAFFLATTRKLRHRPTPAQGHKLWDAHLQHVLWPGCLPSSAHFATLGLRGPLVCVVSGCVMLHRCGPPLSCPSGQQSCQTSASSATCQTVTAGTCGPGCFGESQSLPCLSGQATCYSYLLKVGVQYCTYSSGCSCQRLKVCWHRCIGVLLGELSRCQAVLHCQHL